MKSQPNEKKWEKQELFWWAGLIRGFETASASSPQRVSVQQIVQVAHLLLHPTVSRAAAFEAVAVKFSARAPGGISSEDQVPRSLRVINSHVKSHIMRPGDFLFFFLKEKSILIVLPIPLFFLFPKKITNIFYWP